MNKKMEEQKIPLGVKLISYLSFVIGIIIIPFIFMFAREIISNINKESKNPDKLMFILSFVFAIPLLLILIVLTMLIFYISLNLKKGKNWCRISQIIISFIFLVLLLKIISNKTFFDPIITSYLERIIIVIEVAMGAYLLLSKKARMFFNSAKITSFKGKI